MWIMENDHYIYLFKYFKRILMLFFCFLFSQIKVKQCCWIRNHFCNWYERGLSVWWSIYHLQIGVDNIIIKLLSHNHGITWIYIIKVRHSCMTPFTFWRRTIYTPYTHVLLNQTISVKCCVVLRWAWSLLFSFACEAIVPLYLQSFTLDTLYFLFNITS